MNSAMIIPSLHLVSSNELPSTSPAMTEPLLKLDQIDTFYGQIQVHFGLNLSIGRGEIVSLLGGGSHDIVLSWTASPSATIDGYNIYRGTASGEESSAPLNSTPINATTYVDADVTPGTEYFYYLTAVSGDGSVESGSSNETSATVP